MKQGETIDSMIIKLALIVEEWRKKSRMKGKAILHALHVQRLVKGLVIKCLSQRIMLNALGSESVGRSVGQSVGRSVSWSVNQFVFPSIHLSNPSSQLVSQWVSQQKIHKYFKNLLGHFTTMIYFVDITLLNCHDVL